MSLVNRISLFRRPDESSSTPHKDLHPAVLNSPSSFLNKQQQRRPRNTAMPVIPKETIRQMQKAQKGDIQSSSITNIVDTFIEMIQKSIPLDNPANQMLIFFCMWGMILGLTLPLNQVLAADSEEYKLVEGFDVEQFFCQFTWVKDIGSEHRMRAFNAYFTMRVVVVLGLLPYFCVTINSKKRLNSDHFNDLVAEKGAGATREIESYIANIESYYEHSKLRISTCDIVEPVFTVVCAFLQIYLLFDLASPGMTKGFHAIPKAGICTAHIHISGKVQVADIPAIFKNALSANVLIYVMAISSCCVVFSAFVSIMTNIFKKDELIHNKMRVLNDTTYAMQTLQNQTLRNMMSTIRKK